MDILEDFSVWLQLNCNLKNSSIKEYKRAINTISEDMIADGEISNHLVDMDLVGLELAISNIMENTFFINKNSTSNTKYSSALKYFKYYVLNTSENLNSNSVSSIIDSISTSNISSTEKERIIQSRVGQGKYRKELLNKYENTCIVTGINIPNLLIASHIKPWSICTNEERIDPENGLILSPNMDKLFDSGLITFTNEGKMRISKSLDNDLRTKLHISKDLYVDLKTSPKLLQYLEYHRKMIFLGKA